MTETTTATKPVEGQPIPGTAGLGPVPATTASSDLALRVGQTAWTPDQAAALRHLGLEHATEPDLNLLYHYAARTGLDPFTKQIYMIGRDTNIKVREVNPETGLERTVEKRVEKFTVQVGIDGWRVVGNRAAKREGVRVGHHRPLYAGADGVWTSVWPDGENPLACEYTLEVDGVEVTSICYFSEYVQLVWVNGKGMVPNSMWAKMPRNQLAKCAEALSWRKAFPADYSGLILEDTAQPDIIDGTVVDGPAPAKAAPKRAKGAERNRQRAHRATEERLGNEQGERERGRAAAKQEDPDPRQKWRNRMFALFADVGLKDMREDQLIVIAELGRLDALPEHRDSIDDETLKTVVHKLHTITESAKGNDDPKAAIDAAIDNVLKSWEYRQSGDDEGTGAEPGEADEAQQ